MSLNEKINWILVVVSSIALPVAYISQDWIMVGVTTIGIVWGLTSIAKPTQDTHEKEPGQ